MLLFTMHLLGTKLLCRDGEAGTVKDVLFEDDSWKVRYLSARLGLPVVGKKVLLAPVAFSGFTEDGRIVTPLAREALEAAPALEDDLPVSKEQELAIHEHFAWPVYWGGPMALFPGSYTLATASVPGLPNLEPLDAGARAHEEEGRENHLRSCDEILGYRIHSNDGEEFGEVVDFALDESTWEVAHFILDTSRWVAGKSVAAPPSWVKSIDWAGRSIHLNLTREMVDRVEPHECGSVRPRASRSFGRASATDELNQGEHHV